MQGTGRSFVGPPWKGQGPLNQHGRASTGLKTGKIGLSIETGVLISLIIIQDRQKTGAGQLSQNVMFSESFQCVQMLDIKQSRKLHYCLEELCLEICALIMMAHSSSTSIYGLQLYVLYLLCWQNIDMKRR